MQIQFAVINVSCCEVVQPNACMKNEALGFCVCVCVFFNMHSNAKSDRNGRSSLFPLPNAEEMSIVHPKSINLNFMSEIVTTSGIIVILGMHFNVPEKEGL